MPRIVKGPDGISHIFPDDATDAEISGALNQGSTPQQQQPEASAGQRFAEGAWKNLNPMNALKALAHPIDTIGGLIDSHLDQLQKAKTAYDDGRYSEMIGHLGGAALPVLGPVAAAAGERIGEGDIAGGLGEGVGLIGATQTPKLIKPTIRGARAIAEGVSTQAAKGVAGAALDALDPDLVSIASPRAGAVVRKAQQVRDALNARGKTTPVEPPVGPPAETPLDLTRRLRTESRTTPPEVASAVPKPAPAVSDTRYGELMDKFGGKPADAAKPATGPKNAPVRNPDTGQWSKTAAFDPRTALQSAKDAFEAIGETPRPGEASNAMELIREGKSPTEAVAQILSRSRPSELSPAAELARRLGTPTEAERIAAQDARWQRGEVKTPSAETARANRKK